jgi:acyl-CoA-binding protein
VGTGMDCMNKNVFKYFNLCLCFLGVSKEEAEKKYIAKVEELKKNHGMK